MDLMYAWQTPEMPTFTHQHPKTLNYLWARDLQNSQHKDGSSIDRIPSTNPGADPPRDTRDSGSARSYSTHLETSSSDRP